MSTEEIDAQIVALGNRIKDLKARGAGKEAPELSSAVADLLKAKEAFKAATGTAWAPAGGAAPAPAPKKEKGPAQQPPKADKADKATGGGAGGGGGGGGVTAVRLLPAPPPANPEGDLTVTLSMMQPADLARHVLPLLPASAAPKTAFINSLMVGKDAHQPYATGKGGYITGDVTIARYLAKATGSALLPADPWEAAKVDMWLDLYTAAIEGGGSAEILALAEQHLADKTYLVDPAAPTLADVAIYILTKKAAAAAVGPNLARFAKLVAPSIKQASSISKPGAAAAAGAGSSSGAGAGAGAKGDGAAKSGGKGAAGKGGDSADAAAADDDGGAFLELPGAVEGKVVTRFPPEPSGYLHIGHAKAVLLNQYYAQRYKGRLLVRFDDTNPSKEKEEFEENIIQDLATLNVVADQVSHTSDHFPKCEELARQMIVQGKAYMDNTDQETMQAERMARTESRLRDSAPADNLALFENLLKGDETTKKYCLRAKIDMGSVNGTMRDPVLYRGNDTPHHRTGTKHKAYPTYDFACPIVDSLEGVTHALRTTEYNDRDEQYHWLQEALGLKNRTKIQAFGKMNFVHTCLSKRKLAWFVENKLVEGWFDPRFPTIQGCMRRGVTVEGLKGFILSQGASRRVITMEWDKFWAENKQVLETTAHRFMGVTTPGEVVLTLTNVAAEITAHSTPLLPQLPDKGTRVIRRFNKVLIDQADAALISKGEQVTLLRWGNVTITAVDKGADGKVLALSGEYNADSTDFKKTKKYTWLAATPDTIPALIVDFDYLISKHKLEDGDKFEDHLNKVTRTEAAAVVDPCLRTVPKGAIIQLERMGFFRVDEAYSAAGNKPVVLFKIPDGKAKCCANPK